MATDPNITVGDATMEWFDEKIAKLNKGKEKLQGIKDEITRLESQVDALKAHKPLKNSKIIFQLPAVEGKDTITMEKTITFTSEEDLDIADNVRLLVIYEIQKRIGKLKQDYARFSPYMMENIFSSSITTSRPCR